MFVIAFENSFKKEIKLMLKRGANPTLLDVVLDYLEKGEALPLKHKAHSLSGTYAGYWECHIKPD